MWTAEQRWQRRHQTAPLHLRPGQAAHLHGLFHAQYRPFAVPAPPPLPAGYHAWKPSN